MEIIKPGTKIDFIGRRQMAYVFSAILILLSLVSLIYHGGPKYGIDFAGGTVVQIQCTEEARVSDIRAGLDAVDLGDATVQRFGTEAKGEYLIRTDQSLITGEGFSEEVRSAVADATGMDVVVERVEMVGPQVGADLREKALLALFYALLFITIYISGRFEFKWVLSGVMAAALIGAVYLFALFGVSIPLLIVVALVVALIMFWQLRLKFAMGAIVALMHDVFITIGIFSLLDIEFSLPIVAALLTIIGYSLNDTIVVFDRIRENINKHARKPLETVINQSINETLSRTIMTSVTTLIVLICLFLLGGAIIHDFALAMIVGVIIGTYSSIYVSSPTLLWLQEAPGKGAAEAMGQA
ncbi:MAG: protein translocase subunit SecF [Desulfobacterales bacterium]